MKNFILYILSALFVFAAAFGITEYLSGTFMAIDGESANLIHIEKVSGHKIERINFTEEDEQKIIEILSKAERKNYKEKFAPVWQEDMKYNIHVTDKKNKQQFFTFGNVNVIYESSDKGGYEIVNAEEIIVEIDALLEG